MISRSTLLVCFIFVAGLTSCHTGVNSQTKSSQLGCISNIWFSVSQTPNPDKIYCTLDLPDSSLFFSLLLNDKKYKINYVGSIYSIDTFHIISQFIGASKKEDALIIGQVTSPLDIYDKRVLDSLLSAAKREFKIVITDTITSQQYEFRTCGKNSKVSGKTWFKSIPKWLFLSDSIPSD